MSALDRAFIRAYRQHGPGSGAPPTAPLDEATAGPPETSQPACKTSIESVLAALERPVARSDHSAPAQPAPAAAPASAPVAVPHERPAARPSPLRLAPAETPAEAVRHVEAPQPVDRVHHRADPAPAAADRPPAAGSVPAPHRTTIPFQPAPTREFVTPSAHPAGTVFDPALRVDRFCWPEVCRRLRETAGPQLDRLADQLAAWARQGRRAVGLAGCRSGDGATTLVLGAAQRLAQRGLKVALADANLARPQLAQRLGLAPAAGWENVLDGRLPLEEVVVESAADHLAILPLRAPLVAGQPAAARMSADIETLARHYELVLVDLGAAETAAGNGPLAGPSRIGLDAVVLVENARRAAEERSAPARRALAARLAPAGVIENFVPTGEPEVW